MANSRKRISELPALNVASLDTTFVLGISGSTTYKISINNLTSSLDTTFATDLVTNALSSSLGGKLSTSSFNSYTSSFTASVTSGTISGSSQLTSSFDTRYTLSGSVVNVNTSSLVNRLNTIESVSGSWITESETGSFLTSLNGAISSSSQLTSSFDTRYTVSGSVQPLPSNLLSSSAQITSLGFVSGSYLTSLNGAISSSEQVLGGSGIYSSSAQINGNIYSAGSSVTIQDLLIGAGTTFGKITTDGNKYISVMPTYNTESARFWPNGNVTIQTGGDYVDNGFRLEVSGSTKILGSFDATGGITGSTNFDTIVNKPTLISGSSQLTSSFDTRYTLSGSVTQTTWDNISGKPTGIVSQSTDLSSLNSYTQSLQNAIELTGSTVSFLGNIIVYGTQSVINSQNVEISDNILYLSPTASTDNDLGVVGHYNDGTYRHAGIFMDASDGHSWKVFKGLQTETTATVDTSGTGFTLADFKAGAFTGTSFNGQINSTNGVISGSAQITSLGFVSGSYLTSLSGAISSSSQLTSSFDTRYTLSGSVVSGTTPAGTISGSAQITAFGFISSSQTINTASLATTGSNSFNGNQTITGSLIVSAVAVVNGGVTIPTGSTITLTSGSSISVDSSGAITGSLTGSVFGIGDVVAFSSSVNSRLNSAGGVAGTISSSAQITSFGFVSGSYETTGRSIVSGSSQIVSLLPTGVISGSSQLTSSYDTRYTLSGSVSAVPSGTISGSAQITAFGFVSSSTSVPAGTISGSSQLTSSFDGRYTQTGSFNTLTQSFNSFTASAQSVTTGSNSFNGTQTITGSLIITTGSFFASQITANTASLYLTSGSNMYVQNNGVVEITGSLIVSGSTTFTGSLTIGSGSITMPDRPAFRVIGAGNAISATTTISGSNYTADYSQGSGWSQSTGLFTAPIAGLYQVNIVARANSNSGPSAQVIVYKTSGVTTTTQIMVEWAANTTANHMGGSTITKLAVGDVLKAVVTVGTISFDGNDNFSVAYIG